MRPLRPLRDLFDALWRAAVDGLHPKVLLLTLLPMGLASMVVFAAGWLFWEGAVAGVRRTLESWELMEALLGWLDAVGGGNFRAVIAPLLVLALALPLAVLGSLFLVAMLLVPALVRRVASRRFPGLVCRGADAAWWRTAGWTLGHAGLAMVALLVTLPLWLVPPLGLLLPVLIWGWLTAHVLAYNSLAAHADAAERRMLMRHHRGSMLAMGLFAGVLGSLPSLLWLLTGAASVIFAPLLMVVGVWLYTLIFAFSTLWFAHFTLAGLQAQRAAAVSFSSDAGTNRRPALSQPDPGTAS